MINSFSGELASRSLPLDSTSERSFEDISHANSISLHGNKRKSKLKVPVPKAWNGAKDEEIVVFLARMELYFQAHNEPKAAWSTSILQFLSDKTFQLWSLELQALKDSYASQGWNVFCAYMKKLFGVSAPERRARNKFDHLRQTGDVESFANELCRLVRIMSPLPMVCPSEGDITRRFVDGCKPDIKAWLVAHTPDPCWESSDQCIQSAINRAANRIDEHRTDTFAPRRLAAMDRNSQKTKSGHKNHRPNKPPFDAGHWAAQAMAGLAEAGPRGGGNNNRQARRPPPRQNNNQPPANYQQNRPAGPMAYAARPIEAPPLDRCGVCQQARHDGRAEVP